MLKGKRQSVYIIVHD